MNKMEKSAIEDIIDDFISNMFTLYQAEEDVDIFLDRFMNQLIVHCGIYDILEYLRTRTDSIKKMDARWIVIADLLRQIVEKCPIESFSRS